MRDYCRLCVKCSFQGDHIGTPNLLQSSKQTGSFDVIRATLYVWKCWIANSILRAENKSYRGFLLVEEKSVPFITGIRLCQAPCLVLETRRQQVKRDSSGRFKSCLQTSVSSPDWIPATSKLYPWKSWIMRFSTFSDFKNDPWTYYVLFYAVLSVYWSGYADT